MEVSNIFMTKNYDINEVEKVPIIKNCLGRESLKFIQTLTEADEQSCQTITGLLKVLDGQIQAEHNDTIPSLQYYKLIKHNGESAENGQAD